MSSSSKTSQLGGIVALFLCALIWGFAFSAQSLGMKYLGACGFNAVRFFIGGLTLMPCIAFLDFLHHRRGSFWGEAQDAASRRTLLVGGAFCGVVLGGASLLQQVGIIYASVGKAGFLTTLYIILVPILGHFLGQKITPVIWLAAVLAMLGMALLCNLSFSSGLTTGDYWLLGCAFLFAAHILVLAHFAPRTDCVRLSCIQFFVAGMVSFLIFPFTHETLPWTSLVECLGPLLVCGVLSSGIAYTLQAVGEKYVHPVVATLLMSLESVFSAVGGWLILHQSLSMKEMAGCAIIFTAVLLAQIRMTK